MILNICVAISFITTLLALVCCSFIIVYSDILYQSYQQLQCAAGRVPYSLLKGAKSSQNNWIGLENAEDSLSNITTMLQNSFPSATKNLWSSSSWLFNDNSTFYSELDSFVNNYAGATVYSPNPGNSTPIELLYTYQLGPDTSPFSYSGMINFEYLTRINPILIAMQGLYYSTNSAAENVNETTDQLSSSKSSLNVFVSGNEQINDNVNT